MQLPSLAAHWFNGLEAFAFGNTWRTLPVSLQRIQMLSSLLVTHARRIIIDEGPHRPVKRPGLSYAIRLFAADHQSPQIDRA